MQRRPIDKFPLALVVLLASCSSDPTSSDEPLSIASLVEGDAAIDEPARQILADAIVGERLAAIDLDQLAALTDAGDVVGRSLEFSLAEDLRAKLIIDEIEVLVPGVRTYSGRVEGDEASHFSLSVEADAMLGVIHTEGYAWMIEPRAGTGLHAIRQISPAALPRETNELALDPGSPVAADDLKAPAIDQAVLSNGEVRVLFLVASNVGNGNALAANITAEFNNSLSLSAVAPNNYLTVAGVQPIASTFAGQSRTTLYFDMGNRSGVFSNVDALMAASYADVAFLLVDEDPSAVDVQGYGRVGGVAYLNNPNNPFAISTDDYALGDLTALHELGHVFGGRHEDAGAGAGIARPVAYPKNGWMTIMGGYITCGFTGLPATVCVRLNRWSNPDQSYDGRVLGVAGQSDMESWLEGSMPSVSNWRESPPLPPAAPSPLTKQSEQCFGFFTMNWAGVAGATEYQLHASTNVGFTQPFAVYVGPDTTTWIDVPNGTWYLRARACNGGGCSSYTSQVSAARINVCL
ncbi:hypothetical protein ACNOYE_09470 [Nannocystaceae bacterium ST9]